VIIRKADSDDYDAIWDIFEAVIQDGDTYVFSPDTPKSDLIKHWLMPHMNTYVAEIDGDILGTYILKPNQIDLGSHVANGSYMVHPNAHRKGVGLAMAHHSLSQAKTLGFLALQFNFVVGTNKAAMGLWKKLGFALIGTVPEAFKHSQLGYVDALILYKKL
jgi:L-amino acid N-acyltransferase YncA